MVRLDMEGLYCDGLGPITMHAVGDECVCISGPSGAGKTRLLRAIADLDVHQGASYLNGTSREEYTPCEWRRKVGLLPPESHWWMEHVSDHFERIDDRAFAALGLDIRLAAQPISQLSSGERQRLALLRLLTNEPQVLLLDEPTANLDAENVQRVESLLDRYRKEHKALLLWVSHDPHQIRRVGTRHVHMDHGKLSEAPLPEL
jgi:ABC-type lipoprotein export system ATPase subunit